MRLSRFQLHRSDVVVSLFEKTFGNSEGASEGKSIGELVQNLIVTTAETDLFGFCADEDGMLLGCIFFSRFTLPVDRCLFMLSPVAVSTQYQCQGVGQALINFGLQKIKLEGVEAVVTYGDPNYYSKVGFMPLSENIIPAPYPLTYPEGWQALSLSLKEIAPTQGKTQVVEAFRHPQYW